MPEAGTAQARGDAEHRPRMRFVIADALEDGIDMAKIVGKRTSDAAEEFMDDNVQRIKRHPVETVVTAFVAGFVIGGFLCWMSKHT